MLTEIDLNCDLGEGCSHDSELMAIVTSVNIACGFHAGDPSIAYAALQSAVAHGVQAGAHPGFPDREHFGRKEMARSESQILEDCAYQVGALDGLARTAGCRLRHLKPHGALYNMACKDDSYARPLVGVAELFALALMGLPGSRLEVLSAGRCPFVAEGFADRRYLPDGSLVPRSRADAFVANPDEAVHQVERLLASTSVRTICVHGDNPEAVRFVQALRAGLEQRGIAIRPFVREDPA
jgi:UPF0271 protein